ncbi:MAG: hypothetical protein ACQEP8_02720 [Chlamydiota bacterium]
MARRYLLLVMVLIALQGCSLTKLDVERYPIDKAHLASSYVNTPDPRQEGVYIGQRMIAKWSLPEDMLLQSSVQDLSLKLLLTLRFGNSEEKVLVHHIKGAKGSFEYVLKDEDYLQKDGIQTYKAEILLGEKVITSWNHQMWTDYINVI